VATLFDRIVAHIVLPAPAEGFHVVVE